MTLLEHINSPEDIKSFSPAQLRTLCEELRQYILSCCSVNPGHVGSSLGAVEIAVAIHKVFDTPADKVVWDVGHQAYAHKILTGRREAFVNNRKAGGISGFPKMSESPYDSFGAGHSSTSISAALGMAAAERLKGGKNHVVAVIGDGAMTGGLAFEGLNNAGASKADLLVIFNDNGISIDKDTGGLHNYLVKLTTSSEYNRIKSSVWKRLGKGRTRAFIQSVVKTLKRAVIPEKDKVNFFDSLGFRYFGPIDGNNVETLTETLSRLKEIPGPKLLHVITTKGKGFEAAEADPTVWHAPGTFDLDTGKRTGKKPANAKYQEVFGQTLLELAGQRSDIVGVTPAMATGCSMDIMMKAIPERVFDVGIAEQHAVSMAAGMAKQGIVPVVAIYSSFLQRAYDMLIHDVSLLNLHIVFCVDRAGLVGSDGETHHGVFDVSYLQSVPGMQILCPSSFAELEAMLEYAVNELDGPVAIRYPRGGEGIYNKVGEGFTQCIKQGEDISLAAYGTMINEMLELSEKLSADGISAEVIKINQITPLDTDIITQSLKKTGRLLIAEDVCNSGCMGNAILAEAEYERISLRGASICNLEGGIVSHGTVDELMRDCGLDTESLYKKAIDLVRGAM